MVPVDVAPALRSLAVLGMGVADLPVVARVQPVEVGAFDPLDVLHRTPPSDAVTTCGFFIHVCFV